MPPRPVVALACSHHDSLPSSGCPRSSRRRGEAHRARSRRRAGAAPAPGLRAPGRAGRSCRPSASSSRVVSQVGGRAPPLPSSPVRPAPARPPAPRSPRSPPDRPGPRRPVSCAATVGQSGARAPPLQLEAAQAGGPTGQHQRPDHPDAVAHPDRQVRAAAGVQPGHPGRLGGQRVGQHHQIGHQPGRRRRGVGVGPDPAHRVPDRRRAPVAAPVRVEVPGAEVAGQHRSRRLGVHRAHPGLDQPEHHPDGQRPVAADHARVLSARCRLAPLDRPASTTAPAATSSRSSCSATSSAAPALHRPGQQRRPPRPVRPARPASRPAPAAARSTASADVRIEPEQPTVGPEPEHRPVRRQPEHRGQGAVRGRCVDRSAWLDGARCRRTASRNHPQAAPACGQPSGEPRRPRPRRRGA